MITRILVLLLLLSVQVQTAEKPNILFFLADDHQASLLGALGKKEIKTPHLDKLVRRGTTFSNAHAEIPSCSPSRASILSGCRGFTHKAIYPRFASYFAPELLPDVWPMTMKKAGYRTFWTGKWNTHGSAESFGIEETDCFKKGGMGSHFMKLKSNGKTYKGFSSTLFADAAIRFLKKEQDQPFFMTVSFTAPHDPRTPPGPYKTMYDPSRIALPENFLPEHPFDNGYLNIRDEKLLPRPRSEEAVRREIASYYGMISQMDEQVGRVVSTLEKQGLLQKTIIIFAGDHGLAVGQHGLLGKFSMYDHSTKTPLVFAGPGIPAGVTHDALVYLHDIYPSVCDLSGIEVPRVVEGRSLKPVIDQAAATVRDYLFCSHSNLQRMLRDRRYKLIRYYRDAKAAKGSDRYAFFDTLKDPLEMKDLIASPEHHQLISKMKAELGKRQIEYGDFLIEKRSGR